MSHDINVVGLVKKKEQYIFLFDDESITETLRCLGRFASNPELSFTWFDADDMIRKIREEKPITVNVLVITPVQGGKK